MGHDMGERAFLTGKHRGARSGGAPAWGKRGEKAFLTGNGATADGRILLGEKAFLTGNGATADGRIPLGEKAFPTGQGPTADRRPDFVGRKGLPDGERGRRPTAGIRLGEKAVGEKGFLTGTITRTHGSRGRKGLPDGDDHSHARIAWAKRAS